EQMFSKGDKRREIARVLGPLSEAGGEWERLVQMHESLLTELDNLEERVELYQRMATDHEERLDSPAQAFAALARALQEAPLEGRVREEMERLAPAFDSAWEELANTYADVMSVEGAAPRVQAHVGRQLARVFEEELADVEYA